MPRRHCGADQPADRGRINVCASCERVEQIAFAPFFLHSVQGSHSWRKPLLDQKHVTAGRRASEPPLTRTAASRCAGKREAGKAARAIGPAASLAKATRSTFKAAYLLGAIPSALPPRSNARRNKATGARRTPIARRCPC